MENTDTIDLLKECDAGSKMAVTSIDEVLEHAMNPKLKDLLQKSKKDHETLGNELHNLLIRHHSEEKDPCVMAKGMSWLKTTVKLGMDSADSTIADLMTDGCNMGVKSLHKYLNQYSSASQTAKDICNRLIKIEEDLCHGLKVYL